MSRALGKVLVTAGSVKACPEALQRMRDAGCDVVVATTPQPWQEDWLIAQARDAAGLVVAMEPLTARLFEAARQLRIIARPGAGYDTVDMEAATRHRVAVTIATGANDQSVADHAFGLLLMAARGLVTAVNSVQQRGWERPVGTEVWRKTLAIVGFGRIGQAMARRAHGFDMRVLAVTRRPGAVEAATDVELVGLEQALQEADFLSLHTPLTPGTAGLIDARALARMKSAAFLINTSRGALVDEAALADAVRAGRLAGAAVDVLRDQGPDSPSPLIGVPGILVTPHMASFSREAMHRVAMATAGSIVTALEGERPDALVNPEVYPA